MGEKEPLFSTVVEGEGPWHFWVKERIELVVFRDSSGRVRAFSSICPHMGAQMQVVHGGRSLECPWHGWKVDVESGSTNHKRYCRSKEFTATLEGRVLRIFGHG